jgi:hypothetical protein
MDIDDEDDVYMGCQVFDTYTEDGGFARNL